MASGDNWSVVLPNAIRDAINHDRRNNGIGDACLQEMLDESTKLLANKPIPGNPAEHNVANYGGSVWRSNVYFPAW